MKDSEVAAVVITVVVLVLALVTIVIAYFIIGYRKRKRHPDADRLTFCLDNFYTTIQKYIDRQKEDKQNKNHLKISMTTEEHGSTHHEKTGRDVNDAYSKNNTNSCESVVITPCSLTLKVPQSPIRESAETYSFVDLNED